MGGKFAVPVSCFYFLFFELFGHRSARFPLAVLWKRVEQPSKRKVQWALGDTNSPNNRTKWVSKCYRHPRFEIVDHPGDALYSRWRSKSYDNSISNGKQRVCSSPYGGGTARDPEPPTCPRRLRLTWEEVRRDVPREVRRHPA